ncbi:MAG: carbamoyltransferase [Acidobacteria bacterium]|nr:MAG: carbamoyltransferase [Acidobacteriota bacterium]
MNILGINPYHANASAAVVCDGQLAAAVEEERFNRVKYAAGFPSHAIRHCLAEAGLTIGEIDHVAIPRDPWARIGTKLFYAARMPRFALDRFRALTRFSGIPEELARACDVAPGTIRAHYHRVEHHVAHLASAFFVSPFDRAAVLSTDGLGDFASTMWATGEGNRLIVHGAVAFPHSLGLYYTAISQFLGFWRFGDEYKVMGLAAYGEPAYQSEFRRIVRPANGKGFSLGLEYFCHHRSGPEMTWRDSDKTPVLGRLFSPFLEKRLGNARTSAEPVGKQHQDVAASLQSALEEAYFRLLNSLWQKSPQKAVCLAGGVAFNCVANGKIFDQTPFSEVYVQPAAGDAGLSVGAAYYVHHQILGRPRSFVMDHAYWGPQFTPETIRLALESSGICGSFSILKFSDEELVRRTAAFIAGGKIVGWFQGRAEWGPRALGNRSILVDPRRAEMKGVLNSRIKHREPFRPFAPSILEEATAQYFERSHPSPFMNLAYAVRPEKRAAIPAPTHVDGTGRLQTVSRRTNPRYWALIKEFEKLTGVPVLLNTSFNENEPIVLKPEEAIDCFRRTKMDVLVIGDYLIEKPAGRGIENREVGSRESDLIPDSRFPIPERS